MINKSPTVENVILLWTKGVSVFLFQVSFPEDKVKGQRSGLTGLVPGTHLASLSVQDMVSRRPPGAPPLRFGLAVRAVIGSVPSPPSAFTLR